MNKLIGLLILTLILFNLIAFASAEIIWSQPTTVHFTIGSGNGGNGGNGGDDEDFCDDQYLKEDLAYGDELMKNSYGNWICVNNKLQRTNMINGMEIVEYGGLCGVEEGPTLKSQSEISLIFLLILGILILLILIILILIARKR